MDKCVSPDYEGGYEVREHNFDKKGWCVICGKHKLEDTPETFGEFLAQEKLREILQIYRMEIQAGRKVEEADKDAIKAIEQYNRYREENNG